MQYGFNTDSMERAKAALILYAAYKSRNKNSSMNGTETWSRFTAYIRGACLKSTNTAEFTSNFCKMGGIDSIKPYYLSTDDGLVIMPDGSLICSDNVKDYKIGLLEDDTLMSIFENEGILLTMLVRERIQREKLEGAKTDEIED